MRHALQTVAELLTCEIVLLAPSDVIINLDEHLRDCALFLFTTLIQKTYSAIVFFSSRWHQTESQRVVINDEI